VIIFHKLLWFAYTVG